MKKNKLSTRTTDAIIKYVEHRGGDVDALLKGIPYKREFLTSSDNWVTSEIETILLQRASEILGEADVAVNVGRFSSTPKSLGILSAIARLFGTPTKLYSNAFKYVPYFNRNLSGRVRMLGKGKCVMEIVKQSPDAGYKYCHCEYARGVLEAVPTIFGLSRAKVVKETCELPIWEAGNVRGLYYKLEEDGVVRAFHDEAMTNPTGFVGLVERDGTFTVNGVRFGAECCRYRIFYTDKKGLTDRLRDFVFTQLIDTKSNYIEELERVNESLVEQFDELKRREIMIERQKELGMALIAEETLDKVIVLAAEAVLDVADAFTCRVYVSNDDGTIGYVNGGFATSDREEHDRLLELISESSLRPSNLEITIHPALRKIISGNVSHMNVGFTEFMSAFWTSEICEKIEKDFGLKHMAIFPLRVSDKAIGLMSVTSKKEIEAESIQPIVNIAAQAIWNNRRSDQIRRHKEWIERLYNIQIEMSRIRNLSSLLDYAVKSGRRLTSGFSVRLYLGDIGSGIPDVTRLSIDKRKLMDFIRVSKTDAPVPLSHFDIDEARIFEICSRKLGQMNKVVHFNSLREMITGVGPGVIWDWADLKLGIKDVAIVPLLKNDDVCGLMLFTAGHRLDDNVLLTFASQVSQAMREVDYIDTIKNSIDNLDRLVKERTAELEKANLELKEAQAFMVQREKMASIGQLAAGVAHELNNPLGYIKSNLNTLSEYAGEIDKCFARFQSFIELYRNGDLDAADAILKEIEEFVEDSGLDESIADISPLVSECMEGARRAHHIVTSLKNFSRPGEDRPTMADINEGVESTLAVLNNELKFKARLHKELGDLPPVPCFPHEINQVVLNLIHNSLQALEGDGDIWLKTGVVDSHVEIEIKDNGKGIAPEVLGRVFDPFFTTKPVGEGTGLGLTISYNIVKKHNGEITLESEPGKGTKFTVRLPIEYVEVPTEEGLREGAI